MKQAWPKALQVTILCGVFTSYQWIDVLAETCPSSCGTPDTLSFCKHIQFPTCQLDLSWEASDDKALQAYNTSLVNTSQAIYSNSSDPCNEALRKIHCALAFPVCEIGKESKRLCISACRKAIKNHCPAVLIGLCSKIESSTFGVESKCFGLDYAGPQVGMWIAGFTISLVFSVLNSFGINLQKFSLSRNQASGANKSTFQQPMWVLGFSLICMGSILDFVAFGMAPQSLLAPLAALSLVWNMFIAPIFHKEKITRRNIVATMIIFIGVTITVIYAGHNTPSYELEDLLLLYEQPVMYAYIAFIGLFLFTLIVSTKIIESRHICENGLYHVICYGGIAGTFGGQSVLLAKSTVELLKTSFFGGSKSTWSRIEPYLLIGGLVVCLLSQITFLNGGLKRFDALVIVPVYQSFWILTSVLGGIMYFEEYVSMTYKQTLMFPVGGIITLGGIVYLLNGRKSESDGNPNVKYTELAHLSPTGAWDTDISDEEALQNQLDGNLDDGIEFRIISNKSRASLKKFVSQSSTLSNDPPTSSTRTGSPTGSGTTSGQDNVDAA